ncbi:MAG TPA: IS1595 family transposase [Bacteroidales bacterium]|jgi:predicted Zn-ribbon and HTH transcriptional regulator|nr:transposase [Bacteroidales bacterium]OQB61045.1 MAG: Transposase zinc-ribbon domain protein [Bacteroidetes bacterium ADurb.Bin145]HOU03062.1 IS1595 family transposase [Bacteroidales bacterium]HQG63311.1 IS1595 family transposase [Bacteroidales bacterium]HQK68485.1 IS1595 family transposase [Bacteroidales bacterium]
MGVIFKKELSEKEIEELFSSDERCLEFLAEVKWEHGFKCRKCGNDNYCPGKTLYSRRCTRCKSEESAAAGTIFHNCKFPLHKAFYIAYNVCKGKEDISSYELARRLSLRQMTCWNFKTKIHQAIEEMDSLTENERSSLKKIFTDTPGLQD